MSMYCIERCADLSRLAFALSKSKGCASAWQLWDKQCRQNMKSECSEKSPVESNRGQEKCVVRSIDLRCEVMQDNACGHGHVQRVRAQVHRDCQPTIAQRLPVFVQPICLVAK